VYSGPITVSATETLEAIAVATGYTNSPVATAAYTIAATALPAPAFSPAPGTYTSPQSVTIGDATAGATIYYTTNGSTPTTSSTVYSGPITVSATETLEAVAVETGYANSAVTTAAYTIAAAALPAPTFSPAAGSYTAAQSVTISDATAGTTIYYTTNGSTPTTSSTVYSGPITVSATETLQAIAVATGYPNSAVTTAAYTIQSGFSISLAPTSLSLAPGQSATSTVMVDPINGFSQAVSFGCTGLGAGLSCAFSPPSVTTGGTSATAILTVAANMNNSVSGGTQPLIPVTAAAFLSCAIGFRRRRRFHSMLFIAGLALVLTTLNGCGGYVGTIPPPVTLNVTVTATSGTIQQTATLTVTVSQAT
jgi:LysM repeat protein